MRTLNDIINAQTPQGSGATYFANNPTEFIALVKNKEQLDLAYAYATSLVFTNSEVRKMLNNAYTTSYSKPFQPFFCQLIDFLTSERFTLPVQKAAFNSERVDQIEEIFDKLQITPNQQRFDYSYSPLDLPLVYSHKRLEKPIISTSLYEISRENLQAAVTHHRHEQAIKLSCLVILLLNRLGAGSLLDPEFPNHSLMALAKHRHYEVCAAILLHLSPQTAALALQAKFNDTQDVLQKMISDLPRSHVAVSQAIAVLKDLNTMSPKTFEAFIQIPRHGDLLGALKNAAPDLANELYDINQAAIKEHFRVSSLGFPMKEPAVAPPPYSKSPQVTSEMMLINFALGTKERLPANTLQEKQNKGECRIL